MQLIALLCSVGLAAQLAEPLEPACAALAARYAPRYRIALDEGSAYRRVAVKGEPTALVVWGGGGRSPAAAAAALLHAALRYGLGYDAAFEPQPFDACAANDARLSVAPAVLAAPCADGSWGRLLVTSGGRALVPLREVLLARVPSHCARDYEMLAADDEEMLQSCDFNFTLRDYRKLKSQLPLCHFNVSGCPGHDDQPARIILAAADAPSSEVNKLHKYICENNLSLTVLRFHNTSCYRRTLQYLDRANVSFLFLDRDLWMYSPDLLVVTFQGNQVDGCPASELNRVTDLVHRVGDGQNMQKYAPQIANVVGKFCPSLSHMKDVLQNKTDGAFDIERAACQWALRNRGAFDSWITNVKRTYGLYCLVCADDRLNEEYIRTINEVYRNMKHDEFDLVIYTVDNVNCRNGSEVRNKFSEMITQSPSPYVMGVIAWSSTEGIEDVASYANRLQLPLVLAGPVTPGTPTGPAVSAISGRLEDLAFFYRTFLNSCGWTRIAILSDESTYAKAFSNCLLRTTNFDYIETTVTTETMMTVLSSLRANEARIFIVNTNSSMALVILRSAVALGMTPPQYAWIVREWSPTPASAEANWGDMSHFSLDTAWRGADGVDDAPAGDAALRARLQALWPEATWPTLAAPLTDAILILTYSFSIFHRLYSTNSYSMRHGGYAMNFSQIYDKIRLPGVDRELHFRNGTVETVMVYLEQWRGNARTVLGAWELWQMHPRGMRCGARVRDRPPCSFPAAGGGFVRRCYDLPLYAALAMLALLPVALAAARRARLRRLAVRDLNLLAHILESKRLASVVHGDSLSVHRKIGTGNFGNVYLATLRQSREKVISVAAKELRDESDKEEYLQEAGILQRLNHENIVKFVGVCVFEGSLFILMEYAFHGDLLQYLRARRHLPPGDPEAAHVTALALTRLAREAAAALQYLARCGLVHRDVRAANCLVDERRTLKLADFGLARKLCDNLEYTSIRRTMFPVLWMAPESLSRGTFSTASDVWALGVLCLELVTLGSRPYGTRSPHQVLTYVRLGGHPPLPPDASLQTVSLVAACWRHRAIERASAGDVARYLAAQPRALCPALQPPPDIVLAVPTPTPSPACALDRAGRAATLVVGLNMGCRQSYHTSVRDMSPSDSPLSGMMSDKVLVGDESDAYS